MIKTINHSGKMALTLEHLKTIWQEKSIPTGIASKREFRVKLIWNHKNGDMFIHIGGSEDAHCWKSIHVNVVGQLPKRRADYTSEFYSESSNTTVGNTQWYIECDKDLRRLYKKNE